MLRKFFRRAREAGVLPVLQALVEAQPRRPAAPASGSLQGAVATLRPLLHPGSLILVLSDFAEFDQTTESTLASASLHSDCRLLWITDPLEGSGLPAGSYHAGLPGRLRWLDGEDTRARWQSEWKAREQQLSELSMRANLPLIRLNTHDAVVERVATLLKEPAWAA